MSIDLTKLAAVFGAPPGQKIAIYDLKQSRRMFDQVLDDTVNSLKSNDNSQKKMIEHMKLAHLRMLQGLFSEEDENGDHDLSCGFINCHNLPQSILQQSQIVDKSYPSQQPSLLKSVSPEPTQIAQLIDRVAEKVSLAPELIHSVVSTESAYNPTAVSPAGAQGLMQLMPETAQELGVRDSFDPLQNLSGGSRYLKQLLEKYDGDLDHALAAYNWGQGNVDRRGLENMPEETRNYLTKVKALLKTQST